MAQHESQCTVLQKNMKRKRTKECRFLHQELEAMKQKLKELEEEAAKLRNTQASVQKQQQHQICLA